MIEHHLRVCVAFKFDNHTHTVTVAFLAQIGNSFETFFLNLIGNVFDQLTFVYLVGKFGYYNSRAVVLAVLFELGAGADYYLSSAGCVRLTDTSSAHNNSFCREIRTFDVLHKVLEGSFGVVENTHACVDYFAEIVRRNIGCHTDGYTRRSVYQKVGESRRKHERLLSRFVEVGNPVNRVFLYIAQHFVAYFAHTRFGVTISGRRVAVHRTEVSVTFNQHIAHGEVLSQSHHRVVNRGIAVRMISAQHVADACSRLFERFVAGETVFVHSVQNSSVNRFQSVAHVGERSSDDNRHCILYIAFFHFPDQFAFRNRLIGKCDVFGLIISVMCHIFLR